MHYRIEINSSQLDGFQMAEELTQEQADYLFGLEKKPTNDEAVRWPVGGAKETVLLVSLDGREEFMLDITTSVVKLSKLTIQNRARTVVILARLDIDGAPHRNPDNSEIPCPHIHLYREGYNDKWAYPLPAEHFCNLNNQRQTVADFMRYCSIVETPEFIYGLI